MFTRKRSDPGRSNPASQVVLEPHELNVSGGTMDRPVFNSIMEKVRTGPDLLGKADRQPSLDSLADALFCCRGHRDPSVVSRWWPRR
jgi:hypothetical protein